MRIVLRLLLSSGWINLKNICAHLQEEVLAIPKHPLLAQFDESEAKLWCSKEDRFFLKYFWYSILVATLFFAVFSANTHQKDDFWGCFGNLRISSWWWAQRFWKLMQKWLRKLKLKLATPIWKLTEKHDWWCDSQKLWRQLYTSTMRRTIQDPRQVQYSSVTWNSWKWY